MAHLNYDFKEEERISLLIKRRKRMFIPENGILAMLNAINNNCLVFTYPVLDLPKCARVLSVRYSDGRRGFLFDVHHPDFEPVPEGEYPLEIEVELKTAILEKKK